LLIQSRKTWLLASWFSAKIARGAHADDFEMGSNHFAIFAFWQELFFLDGPQFIF